MQTALADFIRDTPAGNEADRILRACVHCGFCTATCPTYQLLGDELDGPRGRIYQIKQVLEGAPADATVRGHLDRCLTCRSCETTCPSGVDYHRLLDIGRATVERQAPRPAYERVLRRTLIEVMAYRKRFTPLLRIGQMLRPLMPARLRRTIPAPMPRRAPILRPATGRHVLLLDGCVQPGLAPEINQALEDILSRLGIAVVATPGAGCCGALPHHLSDSERALAMARQNIDAWYSAIADGAEALVVSASGCGAHVADYAHLLANDPAYAEKARQVVALLRDPVQILAEAPLDQLAVKPRDARIAVHTPCTLQHALKLNGQIEAILIRLGYALCTVQEGHLCCGSAGTYSMLQPKLSQRLRSRKLAALKVDHPDIIVSANIGCLMHLAAGDPLPVRHWLNLVADDLPA
ncbi:MAG: glycolate oxidase subunit GlcF [Gammaproteobacteria bacterium]|nr:glycolate oxidase subunit GlcF [Gammaproteobacteria bacterium]